MSRECKPIAVQTPYLLALLDRVRDHTHSMHTISLFERSPFFNPEKRTRRHISYSDVVSEAATISIKCRMVYEGLLRPDLGAYCKEPATRQSMRWFCIDFPEGGKATVEIRFIYSLRSHKILFTLSHFRSGWGRCQTSETFGLLQTITSKRRLEAKAVAAGDQRRRRLTLTCAVSSGQWISIEINN